MIKLFRSDGFTLVELTVIIIVIGILIAIATISMEQKIDSSRYDAAKMELEQIAFAVAGNPGVLASGARGDYGYIGDVGTIPSDIEDLIQNTGGLATWDGPYLEIGSVDDYRLDPWRQEYILADSVVYSIGSGDTISKPLAPSLNALLDNSVEGNIRDAAGHTPGAIYADSIQTVLFYPDGSGGINNSPVTVDAKGSFSMTNIPIGNHTLQVVYLPDSDTMQYQISVSPGRDVAIDITFPSELWY